MSLFSLGRSVLAAIVLLLAAGPASAQTPPQTAPAAPPRPIVVDQTNLPLPGVRIDVYRGDQMIQSTVTTAGDGTFD